jgi:hypothetical protein
MRMHIYMHVELAWGTGTVNINCNAYVAID